MMHVGIAVADTDKVRQGLSQEYHDHMQGAEPAKSGALCQTQKWGPNLFKKIN
jgi:hypothetical protein